VDTQDLVAGRGIRDFQARMDQLDRPDLADIRGFVASVGIQDSAASLDTLDSRQLALERRVIVGFAVSADIQGFAGCLDIQVIPVLVVAGEL